jgi:hypothetical protein
MDLYSLATANNSDWTLAERFYTQKQERERRTSARPCHHASEGSLFSRTRSKSGSRRTPVLVGGRVYQEASSDLLSCPAATSLFWSEAEQIRVRASAACAGEESTCWRGRGEEAPAAGSRAGGGGPVDGGGGGR